MENKMKPAKDGKDVVDKSFKEKMECDNSVLYSSSSTNHKKRLDYHSGNSLSSNFNKSIFKTNPIITELKTQSSGVVFEEDIDSKKNNTI